MNDVTDRLGFPLMSAGQSQKEITHNEALLVADLLVQSIVTNATMTVPPTAPQAGQCWIVGRGATGAWQGKDDALAQWGDAGWRFMTAFEGLAAWNAANGRVTRFSAGKWGDAIEASALRIGGRQVVGAQQPIIPAPSGGTNLDIQARATIGAILSALQAHGLISN